MSAAVYGSGGARQASAESVVRETDLGRAVDDVTRLLLARMSSTPADRLESLGALTTASFPALSAYLHGQQAFRANQLESAISAFRRATELDTGFALAWYRMATAAAWNNEDSLWHVATDEAVRRADRLSDHARALRCRADGHDRMQRERDALAGRIALRRVAATTRRGRRRTLAAQ